MGMHKIAKMPSPEELKEEMPLSEEAKQIKAARDKEIRDVFLSLIHISEPTRH